MSECKQFNKHLRTIFLHQSFSKFNFTFRQHLSVQTHGRRSDPEPSYDWGPDAINSSDWEDLNPQY